VEIHWQSRRFYCDTADCPQKIFTERLPEVASAHARKSGRLLEALRVIALSCGGEGGSRLSRRLDMGTSGDTMLRLIRRQPASCAATPRVLGVDDWAFRRGQNYGTILCDLESHHVVDLLPERSAESFQVWLGSHSGVEIISRNRGGYFINGATAGAPNATQVTDRWHLLSNLREALVRIASRFSKQLLAAARSFQVAQTQEVGKQETAVSADEAASPSVLASEKSSLPPADADMSEMQKTPENKSKIEDDHSKVEDGQDQHPSRRRLRYEQVMELYRQGVSQREIARRLGINHDTVGKYVHADGFPEHLGRHGRSYRRKTDRFVHYLWQRWQEGCRNAAQLTRELHSQGFQGAYYSVKRQVTAWRQSKATDTAGQGDSSQPQSAASKAAPKPTPPSSRRVSWLMFKTDDELVDDEPAWVKAINECCPVLKAASVVAKRFREIVSQKQANALDGWIAETSQAGVATELRRFAKGLKSDYAAIRAALMLPWSNGQTEGHVNRLKLIKRQMFGRANFDLLRQRVIEKIA